MQVGVRVCGTGALGSAMLWLGRLCAGVTPLLRMHLVLLLQWRTGQAMFHICTMVSHNCERCHVCVKVGWLDI